VRAGDDPLVRRLERVAEVIRTDKRRDVAIIKTDSRGRPPLALHREAPVGGAALSQSRTRELRPPPPAPMLSP
jgi:hypothetical protein